MDPAQPGADHSVAVLVGAVDPVVAQIVPAAGDLAELVVTDAQYPQKVGDLVRMLHARGYLRNEISGAVTVSRLAEVAKGVLVDSIGTVAECETHIVTMAEALGIERADEYDDTAVLLDDIKTKIEELVASSPAPALQQSGGVPPAAVGIVGDGAVLSLAEVGSTVWGNNLLNCGVNMAAGALLGFVGVPHFGQLDDNRRGLRVSWEADPGNGVAKVRFEPDPFMVMAKQSNAEQADENARGCMARIVRAIEQVPGMYKKIVDALARATAAGKGIAGSNSDMEAFRRFVEREVRNKLAEVVTASESQKRKDEVAARNARLKEEYEATVAEGAGRAGVPVEAFDAAAAGFVEPQYEVAEDGGFFDSDEQALFEHIDGLRKEMVEYEASAAAWRKEYDELASNVRTFTISANEG